MRFLLSVLLGFFLFGCEARKDEKIQRTLTAKEQVAGLKKMCQKAASVMKKRQATNSLYNRLGGEENIRLFSTKLYQLHRSNKKIGHFFKYASEKKFVDNVTKFLVKNSGGGGEYSKNMETVHQSMNITHADFLVAGGDVKQVMKEMGHGENEIQEAVCFLTSFVPVVVKD